MDRGRDRHEVRRHDHVVACVEVGHLLLEHGSHPPRLDQVRAVQRARDLLLVGRVGIFEIPDAARLVEVLERGERLGVDEDARHLGGRELGKRGLGEREPCPAQIRDRLIEPRLHLGLGALRLLEIERNQGAADAGRVEPPAVEADRLVGGARVVGVRTRDRLEYQTAVLRGTREGPDLVERIGAHHPARAAHPPISGPEPRDPAKGRGAEDRSPGLRADGEAHERRGYRGARAGRGASGPALRVPGISARAADRSIREAIPQASGELHHRELPEKNRARLAELPHHGGVLVEHLILGGLGTPAGLDPRGREEILRSVGDAVERAAIAVLRNLALRRARLLPRHVRGHGRERVQLGTETPDAIQVRLGELDGGELARPDLRRQLRDRKVENVLADHRRVPRLDLRGRKANAIAPSHPTSHRSSRPQAPSPGSRSPSSPPPSVRGGLRGCGARAP